MLGSQFDKESLVDSLKRSRIRGMRRRFKLADVGFTLGGIRGNRSDRLKIAHIQSVAEIDRSPLCGCRDGDGTSEHRTFRGQFQSCSDEGHIQVHNQTEFTDSITSRRGARTKKSPIEISNNLDRDSRHSRDPGISSNHSSLILNGGKSVSHTSEPDSSLISASPLGTTAFHNRVGVICSRSASVMDTRAG